MDNPTVHDLRRYLQSPMAFVEDLTMPIPGRPRFGERMADFQREAFLVLSGMAMALAANEEPSVNRVWLERSKGSSKDGDLAAIVLWLLAFSATPLEMRAGAADFDQIGEYRKALRDWLRCNEWLASRVEMQRAAAINPATGSRLEFLTTDAAGSHGGRPVLTVINELSHISSREFAETLADDASKIPWGAMVIALNAGEQSSWQWTWRESFREEAQTSTHHFFQKYDKLAPWISKSMDREARKRNSPNRYNRLWRGQWTTPGGDLLPPEWIERAVVTDCPLFYSELPWTTGAGIGVDLGLSRDHAAISVLLRRANFLN